MQEKRCVICGKYSGNYKYCSECYLDNLYNDTYNLDLKKKEYNNLNKQTEQIKKTYSNKFYKKNECYKTKALMHKEEIKLFNKLKNICKDKYFVFPQISLRSIIETPNTKTSNEELFKFIDFIIFDSNFIPILAVELNGVEHYENSYTIARDESNLKILKICDIPILNINSNNINLNEEQLLTMINDKIIKR